MATKSINVSIPTFLQAHKTSSNADETKVKLVLNGEIIRSLKELRNYFNAEELMKYHMNGNLIPWLNQHYYENEAILVDSIDTNQAGWFPKLCNALGLNYESTSNMTEEEKQHLEEKKRIVSECTSDASVLSELWRVAMNQEELAELLNRGEKKIYLCNESFSIPIKVSGIEYFCLGNAIIENPFTLSQYKKAGIQLNGFTLPKDENPRTLELAKEAALQNGYDDFHENHTSLANVYHNRLKSHKLINFHRVPYNVSITGKVFKSKSECSNARKTAISNAYNEAEKLLSTGTSSSIAKKTAETYSSHIASAFEDTRKVLENMCCLTGKKDLFDSLCVLVDKSYKNLLEEFNNELNQNYDFYRMYDFDYFISQVDIDILDFSCADGLLDRALEKLFVGGADYMITNLYSAISEIEHDLNDKADTFYGVAHNTYKSYVAKMEDLLEKIGKGLPNINDNEDLDEYITRCCIKMAM